MLDTKDLKSIVKKSESNPRKKPDGHVLSEEIASRDACDADRFDVQSPEAEKASGERTVKGTVFSTQKLFFLKGLSVMRQVEDLLQRIDDPLPDAPGVPIARWVHTRKLTWHCDRCLKAGFVGVSS